MAVLQEIHDKFDTFSRYPYTDHSVISKIKIERSPNGEYAITTHAGGIGSAFDAFVMELGGVERIIGNSAPNRVRVGRDYGPTLVLNVESVEPVGEDGMVEMKGTVAGQPPREEAYIERDNPDYGLFDRLHTEVQGLQPTLQRLLEAYVPDAKSVAHFETSSKGGSVSYDHDNKVQTHHRGGKFLVADEQGNGFFVELDATSKVPFGESVGDVVYRSGQFKPVRDLKVGSQVLAELNADQLQAFTELHREVKTLYQ